jgi:hypothetical protein
MHTKLPSNIGAAGAKIIGLIQSGLYFRASASLCPVAGRSSRLAYVQGEDYG